MPNLPNSLTLLRIFLVPIFVVLTINGNFDAAPVVFIIAAITDGLDGFIARLFKQKTTLGSYLDPLADKTLIIAVYLTLTVVKVIPFWLTTIIISRDLIILTGFIIMFLLVGGGGLEIKPSILSKITTCLQILTALLVLAFLNNLTDYIFFVFIVTAIFTISSGLDYIYKGFKLIEQSHNKQRKV